MKFIKLAVVIFYNNFNEFCHIVLALVIKLRKSSDSGSFWYLSIITQRTFLIHSHLMSVKSLASGNSLSFFFVVLHSIVIGWYISPSEPSQTNLSLPGQCFRCVLARRHFHARLSEFYAPVCNRFPHNPLFLVQSLDFYKEILMCAPPTST